MDAIYEAVLEAVDAGLEEFRRHLRVRVRRAVRESLGQSVGSPAFHIVEALASRGPMSPSDLAATLEVRTSTMASHLDRLEELGWARREPAAPGTNRVRVFVTATGRKAYDHFLSTRRAVLADLLRSLSPQQVTTLAGILQDLVKTRREAEKTVEAN